MKFLSRRKQNNERNFGELLLFVGVILCIYCILSLFDSSLAGDGGREWGKYLRNAWGGAIIVPLLFLLYLSVATLLKFRVPRVPRQVLGTIQLYISFAFMLGLLKETGWEAESTLFLPGNFGHGLARFFVLNVGTFITLLLVAGCFILSAFFFGSKILRISLPTLPTIKTINKNTSERKRPRRRKKTDSEDIYDDFSPDDILFMKKLPTPNLKSDDDVDEDSLQFSLSGKKSGNIDNIQMPKLKPAPDNDDKKKSLSKKNPTDNPAVEKIDNLLAMIDSGAFEIPKKRSSNNKSSRTKKIRRPLPEINFPDLTKDFPDEKINLPANNNPVFPPPLEIFGSPTKFEIGKNSQKNYDKHGKIIISTLKNFGITATLSHIVTGASIVQYQLELAPGMKVNKVSGLSEEIAMALAVMSVRIEAPIPGTHFVGIEVPNDERKIISLRNILESDEFQNSQARLPLPLGVMTDGKNFVYPLEDMPHMLISGDSGAGKNTFINSCILGMCAKRKPDELRLILIDPRHIEFAIYNDLPYLLTPPISNFDDALQVLQKACEEMESRTADFAKSRVRNLAAYNRKLPKKDRLPEIVIVINELSDFMYSAGNEFEDLIVRLAQKSGVAGIYLIISAQRPSPDVVTTLIRSNIPARAVFRLSSQNDSKNILGISDADKLTGKGDMLFKVPESPQIFRLQTPFISEEKVSEFVDYMGSNLESPKLNKF